MYWKRIYQNDIASFETYVQFHFDFYLKSVNLLQSIHNAKSSCSCWRNLVPINSVSLMFNVMQIQFVTDIYMYYG